MIFIILPRKKVVFLLFLLLSVSSNQGAYSCDLPSPML